MARRPSYSFLLRAGLTGEDLTSQALAAHAEAEGEERREEAPERRRGLIARLWRRLHAAVGRAS